ncbi:MAG: 50S ribosomal protein L3 [Planctomycetota bacterium]|jgi:large subunit ribosomal protein L3|nr:50S ribosomal protein L3 [Planctomycetota bacterium]
MWRGILGKKLGMTQYFTENGDRVGVTVLQAGPCPVLQIKNVERDGYAAYQIGFDPKREKVSSQAEIGHAKKTGNAPMRFIREIRLREATELKEGDVITLATWEDLVGKEIQVTSKSKGKGFQGVMKRHGFHGLRATHGVKTHHRHPGSIGSLTPARTPLGGRMGGHMGSEWVTQKGLKVAKIIPEKNLILIRGSVPGANGAQVLIRPAQPYVAPQKTAKK